MSTNFSSSSSFLMITKMEESSIALLYIQSSRGHISNAMVDLTKL